MGPSEETTPTSTEAQPTGTSALLAIASSRPWTCASCAAGFPRDVLLTMDDAGPLCLDCADLGHLEFLARGDAALTRRSKRASRLSAVVVKWSSGRRRYERQGILAEPAAIARAEVECLADHDVRERQRERDAQRRGVADEEFVADLAGAIVGQFPGCSPERAVAIARQRPTRARPTDGDPRGTRAAAQPVVVNVVASSAAELPPTQTSNAVASTTQSLTPAFQ